MKARESKRVEVCREASALIAGGTTVSDTADALGVAKGTLERWLRKWRKGGVAALRDDYNAVGRPAVAADVPPEFGNFIRRKAAMCGSAALTYHFIVDDPQCPPALRAYLMPRLLSGKPLSLPLSLRRLARVTPELAAIRKGPVAFGHVGFKSRHTDMVVDPITGQERKLLAGDIYLSDDMSTNHPFWFHLPEGCTETRNGSQNKLAIKHGVAVGRQGLYTNDARGRWLGFTLLGKPSDAYTAADVLRHFRHILAQHGLPRIGWILEKGVWMARTVDGLKTIISDEAREEVVAGLSSLGFRVTHVHTSEGKALIEGAFGHLQAVCDLLEIPTVGRHRGEMERVEKKMTQVKSGVKHPRDIGLPHRSAHVGNILRAMEFCNGKPKFGRIQHGVPDEVWAADTAAHPLRRLKPEDMGVFFPLKYETRIRQGCVEKTQDGEYFRFCAPELFGTLGAGYRVLVAFDPDEPQAGAAIYNLETGAKNIHGFAPGSFMAQAEVELALPLFGYSPEVAASMAKKKRVKRAFESEYAGTGLLGLRGNRIFERREADGRLVRVEQQLGGGAAAGSYAEAPSSGPHGAALPPSFARRKPLSEAEVERMAREADLLEAEAIAAGLILPG